MHLSITRLKKLKWSFFFVVVTSFEFLFIFRVCVGIEYGSKFYRRRSFKVFNLSQPHVLSLLYQVALLVLYCS